MFIDDLHSRIDQSILVKDYPDIQKKGFVVSGFTKHDRIRDFHGRDFRWRKAEQGGNEAGKYLVVLLQESSEQVIVGYRPFEELHRGLRSCVLRVSSTIKS